MFRSIKSKIFVSHFILITILLSGLSYKHYHNALDSYIQNVITFHTNSSASIIRTSSLAISGQNYGNIQLPSFVNELSSNTKLLYVKIIGKSDLSSKDFNAVYDKGSAKVYRNLYPKDYEDVLQKKLTRFQLRLNDSTVDKIKINFLIARVKDSLTTYNEYIDFQKHQNFEYEQLLDKEPPYLDFKSKRLFLSLKTNNKNSGLVYMVFDISEISDIKKHIIKDLLVESFTTILIAMIILNILSNKIVGPLNKLSQYMSNDFRSLNTDEVPSLKLKDEIGFLAKKFKILLENMQEKQKITEKKASTDSLTGIYNRHKFDEILKEEIFRVKRYQNPFCITILDIDKFKNFNDTFGHLIGDEVLIMLANNLQNTTRKTDTFARWGGEEFVILFRETDINSAKTICNHLRVNIEELNHPLAGSITASFGVTQYKEDDTQESLLKRCDDALYKAKNGGRNRVHIN